MAGREKIWGRSKSSTTCPFCGSKDHVFVKFRRAKDEPAEYAVRCSACGAQGPASPDMDWANRLWKEREEDGDGR